jgi:phosphoribosylaminoimidazole-succinocarboxamide synthase
MGMVDGRAIVIDELCTSDSSRYWSAGEYEVGISPPSFDKQFVRDHYLRIGWDQRAPAPPLPDEVVEGTRARYIEAYEMLTGRSFDEWYGA